MDNCPTLDNNTWGGIMNLFDRMLGNKYRGHTMD